MKLLKILPVYGPSLYHRKPVLIATLDLGAMADVDSTQIPDFKNRLLDALPGLRKHRCSPGYEGGFVERLDRGTYFAHIIEHVALELSGPAGIEVGYGKSVYGGSPGIYKVIVRFKSEEGMKFLLKVAVELVSAIAEGKDYVLDQKVIEAKEIVEDSQLGPSTQAIVSAAEARNIPWKRLNDLNLIQFGYGKNRKLIQATTTSQTSDIAVDIAQDKDFTKAILKSANLAVPMGDVAYSETEAVALFQDLMNDGIQSVVVKPVDGNHGRGVHLGIEGKEELVKAFRVAQEISRGVLIEEEIVGHDHRVIVVNGKMVAAALRVPAHVVGDGVHTVAELVNLENQNPLRGAGHDKPLTRIKLDEAAIDFLMKSNYTPDSVPAAGQSVYLCATANLSTGGSAKDVTDDIHPDLRRLCERAARMVGLDICGIDLMAENIKLSARQQRAAIIEVNAGPGIRMHHFPSEGKPRDVGGAIIDMMYPNPAQARIPIVAITGTNGKTTVSRLTEYLLSENGLVTGLTSSDGIFVQGDCIDTGDTSGPDSARMVLNDPAVEVAVLETARGGIAKRGLGFDFCDVAVFTNISEDHIGQDGIENVDDIFKMKSLIADQVKVGGTLVINAEDACLQRLAFLNTISTGQQNLVMFTMNPENEWFKKNKKIASRYYYFDGESIIECNGMTETKMVRAIDLPITFGGTAQFHIQNAMASFAAARALGLSNSAVTKAAKHYYPNQNLGRSNLYKVAQGYLMIDFGHNPNAFSSMLKMASHWNVSRVTGVLTAPGDRSDENIQMSGEVAAGFDKVILREDQDLRGRQPGEISKILKETILSSDESTEVITELNSQRAIELAMSEMKERELVVYFYDGFDEVSAILEKYQAIPVTEFPVELAKRKVESQPVRPFHVRKSEVIASSNLH